MRPGNLVQTVSGQLASNGRRGRIPPNFVGVEAVRDFLGAITLGAFVRYSPPGRQINNDGELCPTASPIVSP